MTAAETKKRYLLENGLPDNYIINKKDFNEWLIQSIRVMFLDAALVDNMKEALE